VQQKGEEDIRVENKKTSRKKHGKENKNRTVTKDHTNPCGGKEGEVHLYEG